ncbi:hypothetical protein Ancab_026667 [Ancistrocladus abbreviatus]
MVYVLYSDTEIYLNQGSLFQKFSSVVSWIVNLGYTLGSSSCCTSSKVTMRIASWRKQQCLKQIAWSTIGVDSDTVVMTGTGCLPAACLFEYNPQIFLKMLTVKVHMSCGN